MEARQRVFLARRPNFDLLATSTFLATLALENDREALINMVLAFEFKRTALATLLAIPSTRDVIKQGPTTSLPYCLLQQLGRNSPQSRVCFDEPSLGSGMRTKHFWKGEMASCGEAC